MFKQDYLDWLEVELNSLLPSGYNIHIKEEIDAGSNFNGKFDIYCYVKFGSATKQNNASDRINQPIIFNIFSEAEGFKVAEELFSLFFLTYSKKHTTLLVDEVSNDLWHFYNSPSLQGGYNQIGEYQRANIIMTGVVSYSEEKLIGVKWYLDNVEMQAVSPQAQYNAEVKTPLFKGDNTGKMKFLGANNTFGFTMLLDKSLVASKLRDTAVLGVPYTGVLKIEYVDKTYTINVRTTSVILIGDNQTGDNILNISLMPIEV